MAEQTQLNAGWLFSFSWSQTVSLFFFYPIPILHYINNFCVTKGPVWLNELGSWIIYTTHTSLSPIRRGFAPSFVNYKKGCTRLAAASDKVYQLLAHGRWFSLSTLASSTTKTDRHDIAEILLKVALKIKIKIKSVSRGFNILFLNVQY